MGGLGNQMFQYAAGKSLALRQKVPLMIDTSFLTRDPKGQYVRRPYELSAFVCLPRVANFGYQFLLRASRYVKKVMPFAAPEILIEKSFAYDPAFERAGKSVILIGYWQSERYFKNIRSQLLDDFKLRAVLSEKAQSVKDLIVRSQNAVSIHFRRGDYVTLPSASAVHGTTSMQYYENAVADITSRTGQPNFFVFSDDIDWVKKNFPLKQAHYVSGLSGAEDLHLMGTCRHNIIANSSFSWWAAWLNNNPEKIVIAPAQWFRDDSVDTRDLVPAEWFRI
jgi:hypothetical protein